MSGASGSWSITTPARDRVKAWWAQVLKVQNTPIPKADKELNEWRAKILVRAAMIKKMVQSLVGSEMSKEMGLGVATSVIYGGVAISAILAYITYHLADIAKYFKRLDFIKKTTDTLIKSGLKADDALKKATGAADDEGLTSEPKFLGIKVKYIAYGLIGLGIAGFFFSRKNNASVVMVPKS
jgi:hypothetical protein